MQCVPGVVLQHDLHVRTTKSRRNTNHPASSRFTRAGRAERHQGFLDDISRLPELPSEGEPTEHGQRHADYFKCVLQFVVVQHPPNWTTGGYLIAGPNSTLASFCV